MGYGGRVVGYRARKKIRDLLQRLASERKAGLGKKKLFTKEEYSYCCQKKKKEKNARLTRSADPLWEEGKKRKGTRGIASHFGVRGG